MKIKQSEGHSSFTIESGRGQFTIHHSQFTIHHSPLKGGWGQFTIHHSPFTIHNSQFTIQRGAGGNSPFTIHNSPLKGGGGISSSAHSLIRSFKLAFKKSTNPPHKMKKNAGL
jgi:hypothetical protein